jgi:uncharacterized protein
MICQQISGIIAGIIVRVCPTFTESTILFGPRATGKSTWIESTYPNAKIYDLLDEREALRLARDPRVLGKEVAVLPREQWIVIDEVQRVPALLNDVHRLIEKEKRRFILSGSSARKLRKGDTNLLGGRAEQRNLFPFVSAELGDAPPVSRIHFGMLPKAYLSERPQRFLNAYATLYLREEVEAEALTRNIGGFARFLEVAARQNGQTTNASSIARDAQVVELAVKNTAVSGAADASLTGRAPRRKRRSSRLLLSGIVSEVHDRRQPRPARAYPTAIGRVLPHRTARWCKLPLGPSIRANERPRARRAHERAQGPAPKVSALSG